MKPTNLNKLTKIADELDDKGEHEAAGQVDQTMKNKQIEEYARLGLPPEVIEQLLIKRPPPHPGSNRHQYTLGEDMAVLFLKQKGMHSREISSIIDRGTLSIRYRLQWLAAKDITTMDQLKEFHAQRQT